ncbi:MAG: outer membrane beta-barrel protein [Luteitalea sp.]|nr:outer membrane beta-barrel protein [Luteitalea sp.]
MRDRAGRIGLLIAALSLGAPAMATAEWQIKPFVGLTLGGDTTLVDFDNAADKTHVVFGVGAVRLGEIFGIEGDVSRAPGFFESGNLVLGGSVTTLTGNLVVAVPRRVAGYGLRPYLVAGAGLMRANIEDDFNAFPVKVNFGVVDLGGGTSGFLSDRVGVNWDVRWFRSVGSGSGLRGISFGSEKLSFWRAGMALAIRY